MHDYECATRSGSRSTCARAGKLSRATMLHELLAALSGFPGDLFTHSRDSGFLEVTLSCS